MTESLRGSAADYMLQKGPSVVLETQQQKQSKWSIKRKMGEKIEQFQWQVER